MPPADEVDILLGQLSVSQSPAGRLVQRADGTSEENPYRHPKDTPAFAGDPANNIDALFGSSTAYVRYKKENYTHRLILWMRLNRQKPKEIAVQLGITPQTVYNVCGQPWFQEAFCRLSAELGQDAVTTFLEGEVLPALVRTVNLAQNSESEAVQLAANKEILDRFLGKSIAKTEIKGTIETTTTVYDAAKLLKEQAQLAEQLKSRGIGAN